MGVLPDHLLVCQLPSHHHLPVLAVPLPITKQRKLFCLLVHCGIPILSHYPSWHAPSSSNSSFPLLGGAGHFPQKSLSENPRIGSPFSPPPDHTLSYLWPMAHHSCTGWVQVGGAWALCVFHFCVRPKLVCCSCICHGLEAHLFIMFVTPRTQVRARHVTTATHL